MSHHRFRLPWSRLLIRSLGLRRAIPSVAVRSFSLLGGVGWLGSRLRGANALQNVAANLGVVFAERKLKFGCLVGDHVVIIDVRISD